MSDLPDDATKVEPAHDTEETPVPEAERRPSSRSIPPPLPPPARRKRVTALAAPVPESPSAIERALAAPSDDAARALRARAEIDAFRDDAPLAAMLAYELGELYERRLRDHAGAEGAYRRAVALDASLAPARWGLERVLRRAGRWAQLAQVHAAAAAAEAEARDRADHLVEQARALARTEAGAAAARPAIEAALAAEPRHLAALLELDRLTAASGDRSALIEAHARLAGAFADPERACAT